MLRLRGRADPGRVCVPRQRRARARRVPASGGRVEDQHDPSRNGVVEVRYVQGAFHGRDEALPFEPTDLARGGERLAARHRDAHTDLHRARRRAVPRGGAERAGASCAAYGDEGAEPLALEAASFLAEALAGQRRDAEAADIRGAVLDASRRALGEESGQTLNAAGRLASSLSRIGRYAAAEALLRRSIETTTRVFGPADLHTLGQQHALAQLFRLQGTRDEAERLLRGVLAGTRRILGPAHPSTVNLVREIAQLGVAAGGP